MQIPETSAEIGSLTGLTIYSKSVTSVPGAVLFLAATSAGKRLGLLASSAGRQALLDGFSGIAQEHDGRILLLCPLSATNAAALRDALHWLRPRTLGLATSAGCGDRLGLATPGHIRAARRVPGIAMIFAQQSIREMSRTGRTPQEVMDDATWGIFQEGWREGVGADADHLKTAEDIERCAAAGLTFFTIDPGEHVDGAADQDDAATLRLKYRALPWSALESDPAAMSAAYAGRQYDLDNRRLLFTAEALLQAAVKYGRALAHTAKMYRVLVDCMGRQEARHGLGGREFELEVSVDETDTPTTVTEHLFIAAELRRLGVRWVSLAPRYVGRFEKGVDYIPASGIAGDLAHFESDFKAHSDVARAFGPYKLSLHSGSDKFSIYKIAADHTNGLVHLKTAGTSYLEALRATAGFDPVLFREIYVFARSRYETDRASYHVSASLARTPAPNALSDADLPTLLDQFDARQILHVTFGSVLTSDEGYRDRLMTGLACHEEAHYAALERHFVRHLEPLRGKRHEVNSEEEEFHATTGR